MMLYGFDELVVFVFEFEDCGFKKINRRAPQIRKIPTPTITFNLVCIIIPLS